MILLPNGCHCSEITVSPKNWESIKVIKSDWYLRYYFYDPNFAHEFPGGKPVIVKKGLNYYKDPAQRRELVKALRSGTLEKLKVKGYNPITNSYNPPPLPKDQIGQSLIDKLGVSEETGLMTAIIKSWERLSGLTFVPAPGKIAWKDYLEPESEIDGEELNKGRLALSTLRDMASMINHLIGVSAKIGLSNLPMKDVSRRYIKILLDSSGKSANRTKKFKNNLSIIFNELIEMLVIEDNPTDKIKNGKIVKKKRDVLTRQQRVSIDKKLAIVHPPLHRFMHIFFHSGARETELFRLKASDVNLESRTFKVVVKKRRQYTEVEKVIKEISVPFWRIALSGCRPNDYVFSFGLVPGPDRGDPDIVNKLFKKLVKEDAELGCITQDFYTLKHAHTTEVSAMLSQTDAMKHNDHTTLRMVQEVYDVEYKKREELTIQKLNNPLA